jgi:hypothetical protein
LVSKDRRHLFVTPRSIPLQFFKHSILAIRMSPLCPPRPQPFFWSKNNYLYSLPHHRTALPLSLVIRSKNSYLYSITNLFFLWSERFPPDILLLRLHLYCPPISRSDSSIRHFNSGRRERKHEEQ